MRKVKFRKSVIGDKLKNTLITQSKYSPMCLQPEILESLEVSLSSFHLPERKVIKIFRIWYATCGPRVVLPSVPRKTELQMFWISLISYKLKK